MNLLDKIQEEAKRLLEEKKVDVIIGYRQGSLPLRSTPVFIRDPEDVKGLIFDPTCSNNLALYPKRFKERVGVIVRGCDGRSLTSLLVDRQLNKENLLIIGVPCSGIIDRHKVYDRLDGKEIRDYSISKDKIEIKGRDFKKDFDLSDVLSDSCKTCRYKSPPVYDLLIGEVSKVEEKFLESLSAFEEKPADERWRFFENEFSRCIRCYACRQVCPVCYCEYCIVDRTRPLWFGKTTDLSDTMIFHIIRAYHTAGRCVDCGVCSLACPMGIDLRLLNKRLEMEVMKRFGFEAGLSLSEVPPLSAYKEEDTQEFIM